MEDGSAFWGTFRRPGACRETTWLLRRRTAETPVLLAIVKGSCDLSPQKSVPAHVPARFSRSIDQVQVSLPAAHT
jgi:hypothetical protein